jgi:hypothetical protein
MASSIYTINGSKEMDISDFLQYPQYFSLVMIWASGYVFVYSVFHSSRAWKEFDSTIKIVIALLAGFAIEFCLVLPIFYLINMANIGTPLLLPAFDATWEYNWVLTAFVAVLFLRVRNKEVLMNLLHITFSKVLYYVFFVLFVVFAALLFEFEKYSSYLIYSIPNFLVYLIVNLIFSLMGFVFCVFFTMFTERAYEEEKVYGGQGYTLVRRKRKLHSNWDRRLFRVEEKARTRLSRLARSAWRFALIAIPIVIIASIIPLDQAFTILTPKVVTYSNVNESQAFVYMSLSANFMGFNEKPLTYSTFNKTTTDVNKVISPMFDKVGSIYYPLNSQCLNQQITLGYYPQFSYSAPTGVSVISDYSLKNDLSITMVPNSTNPSGLEISYGRLIGKSFNFTLTYWEPANNDAVIIQPSEMKALPFNDTYDNWTQSFQITNNAENSIFFYQFQYDRLGFQETNRNATNLTCNGTQVYSYSMSLDTLRFFPIEIKEKDTITFEISFLSTNKSGS